MAYTCQKSSYCITFKAPFTVHVRKLWYSNQVFGRKKVLKIFYFEQVDNFTSEIQEKSTNSFEFEWEKKESVDICDSSIYLKFETEFKGRN